MPEPVPSPFAATDAPHVAAWPRDARELSAWCGRQDFPLPPSAVTAWQALPYVRSVVLRDAERPCAYGELWIDEDLGEVELARLIVAPDARGRGVGRRLTRVLLDRARETGLSQVFLRVAPTNEAAVRCYVSVGFRRVAPEQERRYNEGQPRLYLWFQYPT